MNLSIKDKVAIISASSKGLGRACAEELAAEGCNLTIFSRNSTDIRKTADEIREKYKTRVLSLRADAKSAKDIKNVVKSTIKEYKTVHILINNAGGPPFGYFEDFKLKDWQSALELNLLSVINLTKEVIPYMKKQKWGRIINITSIAVKQPIEGLILSNTARAGVTGFAKTLSNEYGKFNILVNNLCPGRIMTDRIKELAEKRAKETKKDFKTIIKSMESDIPVGRIGSPEEFSSMVAFLASEKASYITGNTIQIDGGYNKGLF